VLETDRQKLETITNLTKISPHDATFPVSIWYFGRKRRAGKERVGLQGNGRGCYLALNK
jgi:hypothetical protein